MARIARSPCAATTGAVGRGKGAFIRGERAITPDTALRFGRFFGNSAEFRTSLQTNYDLTAARKSLGERIDREVEAASPTKADKSKEAVLF